MAAITDTTKTEHINRPLALRNTPGYQNYVISTDKTIDGVVGSSVYKKYYSDTSVELYFNGHWVEDINAIQWNIDRQVQPLFGYNSFIYDDIALGVRRIIGSFRINFTEPNRLSKLIEQSKIDAQENADTVSYETLNQKQYTTEVTIEGTKTSFIKNPEHGQIWSSRFDIDVVFGESDILGNSVVLPNHIILWDCVLVNSGIMAATNDGVLQESYSFIARDFKVIK